jgi:hypothetical protein
MGFAVLLLGLVTRGIADNDQAACHVLSASVSSV